MFFGDHYNVCVNSVAKSQGHQIYITKKLQQYFYLFYFTKCVCAIVSEAFSDHRAPQFGRISELSFCIFRLDCFI